MIVDFTEIPVANATDGSQDQFELFARDFSSALGFTIIHHPDRGPDGGKDVLISEALTGIRLPSVRKWLLSAKHLAHSGKSVREQDETNIRDRVERFQADGFLGFYSTLPSSGLSNAFHGLADKILVDHFDRGQIEQELITNPQLESVFRAYFPMSFLRFSANGGYSSTTKDLNTTFIGGNAYPVIFYTVGAGVCPNIKNEGQYTLYDLDVKISSPTDNGRYGHYSSVSEETFPFLHPGSQVIGNTLRVEDVLERRKIESVVAARNGCFYQTAMFAPYRHPENEQPPHIAQLHTVIYWQKHNSQHRTMIYNKNTVLQAGDTGKNWTQLSWDDYSPPAT